MSIYVGTSEIKNVYVGTTPIKEVYVGTTKVRPSVPQYLCFTANTAGSTVKLNIVGSPAVIILETSTDLKNWTTYTIGTTITLSNIGDKVYWRNARTTDALFSTSSSNYYQFVMTGSISASGDVNYLLNKNLTTSLSTYCFCKLFYQCASLTKAPTLPSNTLANGCYSYMFQGCTGLTAAPVLPAITLAEFCYYYMFRGCTGLTTPPSLPATTLYNYCYQQMFQGCTGLTNVPALPATTLANGCYSSMFQGCTGLTNVPALPATTLTHQCYRQIFCGCSKIKLSTTKTGEYQTAYRIPTTGTGTTATEALDYMFLSTGGTFAGTPTINTTYYTSNEIIG